MRHHGGIDNDKEANAAAYEAAKGAVSGAAQVIACCRPLRSDFLTGGEHKVGHLHRTARRCGLCLLSYLPRSHHSIQSVRFCLVDMI
jgi:hypothetical protein